MESNIKVKPSQWKRVAKGQRELRVCGRYFLAYQANGKNYGWNISEFELTNGEPGMLIEQIAVHVGVNELCGIVETKLD